jgi:hypothetical protein
MFYVEAPEHPRTYPVPAIFVAGDITGCGQWQRELFVKVGDINHATYFNPCREKYPLLPERLPAKVWRVLRRMSPAMDPAIAEEQIKWEYTHLWRSQIITFWFPKESVCPIALYELGMALCRNALKDYLRPDAKLAIPRPRICVGIEPGYKRAENIRIQMKWPGKDIDIVDSLDGLSDFIHKEVETILKEDNEEEKS